MEEYTPETEQGGGSEEGQFKRWFQDNLRIIVSIAIVIVIAGGIYSYSKRGEVPVAIDATENVDAKISSIDTIKADEKKATATTDKKEAVSVASSQETESSFVETAGKGGNLTVLARKATANYLEKNTDSTLTKEHKIYIEDYLRKAVGHKGGIKTGTSVEFSKDLIQKAISKSKTLNERQLKNLQKYSARVSSL